MVGNHTSMLHVLDCTTPGTIAFIWITHSNSDHVECNLLVQGHVTTTAHGFLVVTSDNHLLLYGTIHGYVPVLSAVLPLSPVPTTSTIWRVRVSTNHRNILNLANLLVCQVPLPINCMNRFSVIYLGNVDSLGSLKGVGIDHWHNGRRFVAVSRLGWWVMV
jgi:hypothetical protein